jgi:hypothetical protein
MASRFRAVSTSVSPLATEDPAFLGELEGDPGARGCLEEEVDDRLAPQHRHLLDAALGDLLERLGRVEDGDDLLTGEGFEADEVLAEGRRRLLVHGVRASGWV